MQGSSCASSAENVEPHVLAGYLDQETLAAQLGRTVRTLQLWRAMRVGPPITMIGRRPLYRIEAVKAWLGSQEIQMVRATKGRRGAGVANPKA
jgi:hypothetical protein